MSGYMEMFNQNSDNDTDDAINPLTEIEQEFKQNNDDSDDSENFLYDSMVELKNAEVTPRALVLAGARSMIQNSTQNQVFTKKYGHARSLSFAETIEPLTISWKNVNVYAEIRGTGFCGRSYKTGEKRQLLNNVSGIACPGRLLAIMGPSGCGKTTIMNVLTGRNLDELFVDGDVRANGQNIGQGIKAVSAYVQETDVFIGNLKVKEHLWFHGLMRMDKHFSVDDIETRIEELMVELGLKKCADTHIGIPGSVKGISGGEMKRLGFASELLTNPPVMFLDEPTSGLDSFMAENIVYTLKKMARKNKTILCTIHQPSSETYEMFDDVLLLGNGNVVYMGSSKGASNFFKTSGLPCPLNFNPADHYVHVIASQEKGEVAIIQDMIVKYCKTEENRKMQKAMLELVSSATATQNPILEETLAFVGTQRYKVGWVRQLRGLLWRHWASLIRDTNLTMVRIGQTVLLSVLIGLLYYHQPINTVVGQRNINGAHFLVLTMMSFNIFYTVLNSLPAELPVFFREHASGLYRVDLYFISRNITDLLLFILLPTILSVSFYACVYTEYSIEKFIVLWFVAITICMCSVSMGYFVSSATMNLNLALALSPPIIYFLMMSSGYLVDLDSIIFPLNYMQYVSWFRYGYEILSINEWLTHPIINCADGNIPQINATSNIIKSITSRITTSGSNIISLITASTAGSSNSACYSSGAAIIRSLRFEPTKYRYIPDFLVLIVIIIILRFVAFVCLYFRCRETKKSSNDESSSCEISQ